MRRYLLFLLALLAGVVFAQAPKPKDVVATFSLKEAFGVQHPDQIIDFDLDKPVDATKCYMVAPNGEETPYQVLEGGKKLAIRTMLPASRLAIQRGLGWTCEGWARDYKFDKVGVEQCLSTDGLFFTPGDVVRVDGTTLPAGLERDTDYYVTKLEFREVNGWGFFFIGLAKTPDGPTIPITKAGDNAYLLSQALVADPATDQLYVHANGLHTGSPLVFRTSGELPQPLQAGITYYVCNVTADHFSVSAERGGKPIDLLTPGTGIHEILYDWSWTLKSGRAPQPYAEAVKAAQKPDAPLWEITNGKLGIRIPLSHVPADPSKAPSPVQGVRLADGTWTATAPSAIAFTPGTQVKKVTVNLIENGPLKVVAELTYDLDRALYTYGKDTVCPAGPGKYICRVEVQAGQPSVLFEEDTDCTFSYNIDLKGVPLTQARFRGHSVSDPKIYYRPDGRKTDSQSTDTFFDLPFDKNYASSYTGNMPDGLIRWMHPWDPWLFDSGSYWMLYDKDGGDNSPVIGYFDGRASRLRHAGAVGVGVYTRAAEKSAGITVQAWQRGPDARSFPDPRWQWRLFIGSKGADLRDWRAIQPIGLQMNLHSGISLNKIANLTYDFKEPAAGFGAMYMPKDAVADVVKKLREDQAFYNFSYNAVSYFRDLIDMIRDKSGARVHQMAYTLWRGAHDGLDTLVNQGGIMGAHGFGYWHAGLDASRALMRIDQVLASDKATDADKALVRQAAVFYGAVLWDDDHAPLSVPAGVNLGTANMPVQQQGYRDMYALFLATHPMMKDRADGVVERARAMVRGTINEFGAHMGCTHYIGAANGPLLSTLQQLKQLKIADLFKEEPRLKKYAEFEMNFSTPVDPRFGKRVRPSIGDACPGENTEFLGMLGTSFADVDPALSARLMGLWRAVGKPESDFHGATIFKIDERLPDADPKLGCYHAEGWYSALRFGWNTPNETTAWFVNGSFYGDHASNDLGEPVIYALSAPLSIDFGTMYSPPSPGGFVHSVVLPEAQVGDWKQNPPDVTKGGRWGRAKTLDYQAKDREAWSKASFQMAQDTWTRTMKVSMLKDDLPVIGIRDEFTAPDSKVFMLNLMNDGPIQAPDGPKNVGDSFTIPAGVTKLHYTGQAFPKHPAGGIDWDLYVITDTPQEAFIAQYAHKNVMPETQSILRLKGTGKFQVVIVAYNKGTKADATVTRQNGVVTVTAGANSATF